MGLKFLGRGADFADEHTSAYFSTENKEMVIIDCPVSTFQKLRHIDLSDYEKFYVLITHMHGDCILTEHSPQFANKCFGEFF